MIMYSLLVACFAIMPFQMQAADTVQPQTLYPTTGWIHAEFLKRIHDPDRNVRRRAMNDLYQLKDDQLRSSVTELMPVLIEHARQQEENSDLAVLALGRMGDRSSLQAVREIKGLAEVGIRRNISSGIVSRRLYNATISVMARFDEPTAIQEVKSLLKSENMTNIVQGVEHVKFAGEKMGKQLLPLLHDKRFCGVQSGNPESGFEIRVCDVAGFAVIDIYKLDWEIIKTGPPFSDAQLELIRALVEEQRRKR